MREVSVTFDPFMDIRVKYLPARLLQLINTRFLVRETEQIYELQFSSFAIPQSLFNFRCYHHLEKMRESYAFVFYFVVCDSLFYLIPIIVSTFSLVRFAQELQKSLDFQQRATAASTASTGANEKRKKKKIWNLTRSVFALDSLAFLLSLLIILCFTLYWLVIDPDAVFLFETVHYLNTFFIMVVSFYFLVRKIILSVKVFNTVYEYCVASKK